MAQQFGKSINFNEIRNMTLGEVFGTKPIPSTTMVKLLWKVIKSYDLRKVDEEEDE